MDNHTALDRGHTYGADALTDVLVENSELAYDDAQAIIAAIERQTAVIERQTELLTTIAAAMQNQQPIVVQEPAAIIATVAKVARKKSSPKADAVRDWLTANGDTKLTSVAIAEMLGVSHTLVDRIRHELSS